MEQYIPKDALVAEIERLEEIYKKCPTRNSYEDGLKEGRLIGYKDALNKIDTLETKEISIYLGDTKGDKSVKYIIDTKTFEVKEVDLDFTKEVDVWVRDNGDTNGFFNVQELAKHFFELGMQVSNKV